MPFMVGSTGSVLPAPKRLVNDLVANENDDGAVGAKALDDATNKAKIDADRIFIVAFGCRYSVRYSMQWILTRCCGLHSTFALLHADDTDLGRRQTFVRRRMQHQDTRRQLQR